jgi:hypothetical protein
VTDNRLLRHQLKGRVRRRDGARQALAAIGHKRGKQALQAVATSVKPDTILAWHRKLWPSNVTAPPSARRLAAPGLIQSWRP